MSCLFAHQQCLRSRHRNPIWALKCSVLRDSSWARTYLGSEYYWLFVINESLGNAVPRAANSVTDWNRFVTFCCSLDKFVLTSLRLSVMWTICVVLYICEGKSLYGTKVCLYLHFNIICVLIEQKNKLTAEMRMKYSLK